MKVWWKGKQYIMRYHDNCLTLTTVSTGDLNEEIRSIMFWGFIDTINFDKIVFHGFGRPNVFVEEVVHLVLFTQEHVQEVINEH